MFNKDKKEKLKRQEYTANMLRQNKQEETMKIDLNNFNISKTEADLSYENFSRMPTKELRYKLEHDRITDKEKETIRRIIDERK